jgi:hypothetical protein
MGAVWFAAGLLIGFVGGVVATISLAVLLTDWHDQ